MQKTNIFPIQVPPQQVALIESGEVFLILLPSWPNKCPYPVNSLLYVKEEWIKQSSTRVQPRRLTDRDFTDWGEIHKEVAVYSAESMLIEAARLWLKVEAVTVEIFDELALGGAVTIGWYGPDKFKENDQIVVVKCRKVNG